MGDSLFNGRPKILPGGSRRVSFVANSSLLNVNQPNPKPMTMPICLLGLLLRVACLCHSFITLCGPQQIIHSGSPHTRSQSTGSQSTGSQSTGSQSTGSQSTGSQSTGSRSTGSQSTGSQSTGSQRTLVIQNFDRRSRSVNLRSLTILLLDR